MREKPPPEKFVQDAEGIVVNGVPLAPKPEPEPEPEKKEGEQ